MTTSDYSTLESAEKLRELHAKIDAALEAKGTPPSTAQELRKEVTAFCGLQGRDAGDLLNRLDELKEKEAADRRAMDLLVAETLPKIIDAAERFKAEYEKDVGYEDMLNMLQHVISGVEFFALDEFKACDPLLFDGAREFEDSAHIAFQAMGKYLLLSIVKEHPEVMQLAAERAHTWLSDALIR
jgi:hypothetical protein